MKSTEKNKPARHKNRHTRSLTMLGVLLLLFPLLLPATALAAPRSAAATPPLTRPQQIVDLAGVSVVRLSLDYIPAQGNAAIVCTELGVIIASWPAQNATEANNWVLTDGSLLNASTKNSCAPGGSLTSIEIDASNEFTDNQPALAQLDMLSCTSAGSCSDDAGSQAIVTLSGSSAILFSFHTSDPLPYVDVERAATPGNPAPISIELVNSNNNTHPSFARNVDGTILFQFLTPIANTAIPGSALPTPGTVSPQTTEPGMPYIDGYGRITGMQMFTTTSLVRIADIEALEGQIALPQGTTLSQLLNRNTLSQRWDTGIIDYELGNNQGAIQTLSSIQSGSQVFQAPATFSALAREKLSSQSGTSSSVPSSSHAGANPGFSSWPLVTGLIVGILAIVSLFLGVSIIFGRRRMERKLELEQFEADVEKARQRDEAKEKPVGAPQQYPPSLPLYRGGANYPLASGAVLSESRCPNCGAPVDKRADFCPNCRYALKPTDVESRRYPSPSEVFASPFADARPTVQPQQPASEPKMQDDPAIQAALQRLWDRAGR